MSLEIGDALYLIKIMRNRIKNEMIFKRWIPYQDQVKFEDFKKMLSESESRYDARSSIEILKNVKSIVDQIQGAKDGTV